MEKERRELEPKIVCLLSEDINTVTKRRHIENLYLVCREILPFPNTGYNSIESMFIHAMG